MGRRIKCTVTEDGRVILLDPGFDCLPFIKKVWPVFEIRSLPPPSGFVPSFERTRRTFIPELSVDDFPGLSTERLWEIHEGMIRGDIHPSLDFDSASILDLKIELARREIKKCSLCGLECGVDRTLEPGRCGLGEDAFFDSIFVHIAEEHVINPAVNIRLTGCALRCLFCQTGHFNPGMGSRLDSGVLEELEEDPYFKEAVSIEFVGGNPDESTYAVLKALRDAPDYGKPIVWNNHGYASGKTYGLLEGVVDVWLTDFKYGNNECGLRLSQVKNYWEIAREGIRHIVNQGSKAIIRLLILPGHFDCCHRRVLEFLSEYRERVWISVIENYVPAGMAHKLPALNRTVSEEEIEEVRNLARRYGLKNVWEHPEEFWKGG